MKQLLILLACLLLQNMSYALPTRKVLVNLKPSESLLSGEYVSNIHGDSYNFLCVLYDSITYDNTIVYNGIRKFTAYNIELYYIDLDYFNKCIYQYSTEEGECINIENEIYGPYDRIFYDHDLFPMWYSESSLPSTHYINRHEFSFMQMGEDFFHYNDGTIYKINDFKSDYISPNKKHKAIVDESKRMVTIDGSNYVLPIPVDEIISKSAPDLCLFDDGTCYYVQDVIYVCDNKDFTKDTYCFYITPSEVKAINTEIEYFDFDTHEIKLLNNRRDNNDSHNPRNFWNLPEVIYSEEKGDWFITYDFYLQDKSKRHSFFAKWDHDYILIDGKKYNYACPIKAFYDNKSNSFRWVSIEKNQIVMYNYSL